MFQRVATFIFSISLWAVSLPVCIASGYDYHKRFDVKPFTIHDKPQGNGEWGMYYDLPAERALIEELFKPLFKVYIQREDSKTQCREHDAFFQRWYKSAFHENHFIWSYYCSTEGHQGYEHMQVEIINTEIGKEKINVLDLQTKLIGFGIIGARAYKKEDKIDWGRTKIEWGNTGLMMYKWQIEWNLLNAVRDQIALQKDQYTDQVCHKPYWGYVTSAKQHLYMKSENGLNYYRFPVSCNFIPKGGIWGFPILMTLIEVATTNKSNGDHLAIVDGALASIKFPLQTNTEFVEETAKGWCNFVINNYIPGDPQYFSLQGNHTIDFEDCKIFCDKNPQNMLCLSDKKPT